MRIQLTGLLLLLLVLCNAGCRKKTPEKTADQDNPGTPVKTGSKTQPWNGKITVLTGTWDDFQKLVASQRGKVVVADFWATWCEPCVKELPGLAKLQNKYGDKVVCIAVNLDYDGTGGKLSDDLKKQVEARLRKRLQTVLSAGDRLHPAFRLFLSAQADEDVYAAAGFDSVPTILVFSRSGKRIQIDVNSAGGKDPSYERDVIPVVEKLLKEKPPKQK